MSLKYTVIDKKFVIGVGDVTLYADENGVFKIVAPNPKGELYVQVEALWAEEESALSMFQQVVDFPSMVTFFELEANS